MSSVPVSTDADTLTFREQKYANLIALEGMSPRAALLRLGFSVGIAEGYSRFGFARPAVLAEIERIRADAVALARERGLIDATEILEVLSDGIRFDRRVIRNPDGSFKSREEWPEIAGKLLEQDVCEEETESVRSHDGVDTEGRGGWVAGATVRKSKIKFTSTARLLELAMRHKAVNAMVERQAGDVHVHMHAEITARLQAAIVRQERLLDTATGSDSGDLDGQIDAGRAGE